MIEPEVAFAELKDVAQLAEDMLKYVCKAVLEELPDDMAFFAQRIEGAIERLEKLVSSDFVRMDYTDAIEILQNCGKEFNSLLNGVSIYLLSTNAILQKSTLVRQLSCKTTRKILKRSTCALTTTVKQLQQWMYLRRVSVKSSVVHSVKNA